jgi:hypothetical protein
MITLIFALVFMALHCYWDALRDVMTWHCQKYWNGVEWHWIKLASETCAVLAGAFLVASLWYTVIWKCAVSVSFYILYRWGCSELSFHLHDKNYGNSGKAVMFLTEIGAVGVMVAAGGIFLFLGAQL